MSKKGKPVLVTTEHRGVFFGYTDDPEGDRVNLTECRCALYWSSDVGGFTGLAERGPTSNCKISAPVPGTVRLHAVTSVSDVTPEAEAAWKDAPIQGR